MMFVALDNSTMIVLMAAGGLFALAGLWLMFRPQPAGEAARIELFGIKVQASSAGLLVFLIGAGFLAVPVFVPRAPITVAPATLASDPPITTQVDVDPASTEGQRAVLLPPGPGAAEKEPNNRATEANQIAPGVYYTGRINGERGDPEDWFVVPTSELASEDMEIHIRTRASHFFCRASVLDGKEQAAKGWYLAANGEATHHTVFVGGWDVAYVRIYHSEGWPCAYELKVE